MKKGLRKPKKYKPGSAAGKRLAHSQLRAKERLGLELTPQQIADIGDKIRHGHSTFVRAKSATRTVHNVMYMGKEFGVTYNKKYNVPETIFERKGIQSNEEEQSVI
jgi:hypothetical protein